MNDTPSNGKPSPLDPTANVQNMLQAAVARLDDLSAAEAKRVNELRDAQARLVQSQIEDERRRVNEQMELRAYYDELLRIAEAKRIDAIRAVDVNAVAVANERATAQATVLANQVSASADTLRALVATTASTVAAELSQITSTFNERLSVVERANYEGKGKESISDPQLAQVLSELRTLQATRSEGAGKSTGLSAAMGVGLAVVSVLGLLVAVIAIVLRIAGI